jgi:LacI family transcriptional regulator
MSEAPNGRGRATLAMVAEAAGVSAPTVSKVLNGRADVSASTRLRVEEALRKHDYLPPASRRSQQKTRSVELVFSDYKNPYFGEILAGVTEAGADAGISVVLAPFLDSGRTWARRLIDGDRQGAIIVTSALTDEHIDAFDNAGLTLVVIDPVNVPKVDISSIGATNWAGGLSATEHLIGLGHTRIAFIGGPAPTACSQARLHGYRAALENAGLSFDPALVSHGLFNYDNGFARAEQLLALRKPPSAVFAGCDPIAFGVMEAARRHGTSVPEQLSVVGFDDTYVAAWSSPPLTTVHQPLQEMGRAALRVLQNFAAGSAPDTHHVELATHLVLRGTTAPLSSARPST